jgi:acetylornithine deacetylase/succinyl-diaminopimelate desuccinylase-like protein
LLGAEIKKMKGYSPIIDWGYYDDDPKRYSGKINIVATHTPRRGDVANKQACHTLILNGHVDIVPAGPEGHFRLLS